MGWGGCSWIFVKPLPADYRRGDWVDCTTSAAAPIVDTALGASNIGGVLYIAGTVGDKATPALNAMVTTALLLTIVDITSAIYGYRATAACREAQAEDGRPIGHWIPRRRSPLSATPAVPAVASPVTPAVSSPPSSPQQANEEPGLRQTVPPRATPDTFVP